MARHLELCEFGSVSGFDIVIVQVMDFGAEAGFDNAVRMPVTLDFGGIAYFDNAGAVRREVEVADFGAEAGFDITFTLAADTRTSWTTVVGAARDFCHEVQPYVRGKTVQQTEYGTLTLYTRQFNVPRGNHGQAILETMLTPGAHMRATWADEWFSLALDGPKVMGGAQVHQKLTKDAATGSDVVQVTFAAIKTLTPVVSAAYNETRRFRPMSKTAFDEQGVSYGIAPSRTATGIPQPGDTIADATGRSWSCGTVEFNENILPGRILVTVPWFRYKADTAIVRAATHD